MPRGDGTGPMGQGPMTGRAMGDCAGYAGPGFANPGFGGRGFGGGMGRGRGRRNMVRMTGLTGWQRAGMGYPAGGPGLAQGDAPTREEQLDALKAQAGQMTEALESIRARIDELAGSD